MSAYFEIVKFNAGDESFDYRDIEVPTLLLHGDDDRLAPIEISR